MVNHELYESSVPELHSEFRDANYSLQKSPFESFLQSGAVIYNVRVIWCNFRGLLSFLRFLIALQAIFVIRRFFKLYISRSVRTVIFIYSCFLKCVLLYPRIILEAIYYLNLVVFLLAWVNFIRILELLLSLLQVN